jgi:type IV pilus assembly protein PilA
MKKLIRQFRYGEKGFTLIELLVVVAILGVIAAVAVPNVGKFMGKGHEEAAATELHNVQTAVMAAMADVHTGTIVGGDFGNTDLDTSTAGVDLNIAGASANTTVGAFIVGGVNSVQGNYDVAVDGTVTQAGYPGL